MYKIFETLAEYNQFTDNGTNLTSGVTYYVKEDGSTHFITNNIDGEEKVYNMTDNENLFDFIEGGFVTLNVPNGTTKIGISAFFGCKGLTSITIPDSVTNIGRSAFNACSDLTSINIPDSVTSIGISAFNKCYNLTNITLPDSVTSIDNGVFYQCTSLTSITIPDSVTEMGGGVFQGCTSLKNVIVEAITPPTLGKQSFDNTNNCPIYVPTESVETYKTATNWKNYASRIQAIPTV